MFQESLVALTTFRPQTLCLSKHFSRSVSSLSWFWSCPVNPHPNSPSRSSLTQQDWWLEHDAAAGTERRRRRPAHIQRTINLSQVLPPSTKGRRLLLSGLSRPALGDCVRCGEFKTEEVYHCGFFKVMQFTGKMFCLLLELTVGNWLPLILPPKCGLSKATFNQQLMQLDCFRY